MKRIGDRFGNIRIGELLGAGGMGEVYEGFDETLQRRVALKTIRGRNRLSAEARARFLREARILSQLDHPNICRIHDFVTQGDTDALVLELIEGRTLDHAVAERPSLQRKLEIALEIAKVLTAAHAEGIIHRDLKPANVMLTEDGQIKVLDFGLARAGESASAQPVDGGPRTPIGVVPEEDAESLEASFTDSSDALTLTVEKKALAAVTTGPSELLTEHGTVMGTPRYMSPEQARGERISTASDMYSFGLLLQTLFTGGLPYPEGIDTTELIARAARGETLPVTGVASDLTALIDRLKSWAPAARPTAVETLERLEWIRDRPKRRLRRLAGMAVVAVIALAGLRYTLDLRHERGIAVAARQVADQRRGQAEDLIGFMLGDLRGKLEPLGKLEILDDVGSEAMEYFAAVSEDELSDEELLNHSRALYQIGEVRISQGNLEGAVQPLEESLALAESLVARKPNHGERVFELGQSHFWVGYVHWRRRNLEAALASFQAYLAISERLVDSDPENLDWRIELASAHSNLGSLLQEQGDLKGALEEFRACLSIEQSVLASDPQNQDWQRAVAASYNTIGVVLKSQGELRESLAQHRAELAIQKALVEVDPGNMHWRRYLAVSYNYVGIGLEALGDRQGALARFRKAESLLEDLVEWDPTHIPWQRDLAIILCRVGFVLQTQGDLDGALERFRLAVDMLHGIAGADPSDSSWQRDLATARNHLSGGLEARGELAAAASESASVLRAVDSLLDKNPTDRQALRLRSLSHGVLARVWTRRGDHHKARGAWESALESIERAARGSRDERFLVPWAQALFHLDRVAEAELVVEQLHSMGHEEPEFVRLLESNKGLNPTDGDP